MIINNGEVNVIIVNGYGGVGKDFLISKYSETHTSTFNISSIDPVKKILRDNNIWDGVKDKKGRKLLSKIKNDIIEYNPNFFAQYISNKIFDICKTSNDNPLIFVHVREPKEIDKLKTYLEADTSGKYKKICTLLIEDNIKNTYDKTASTIKIDDSLPYKQNKNIDMGNDSDNNVNNYNYDYIFYNCYRGTYNGISIEYTIGATNKNDVMSFNDFITQILNE